MPVEIDKLIKKQSGEDKILTLDLISDMLIWSKPQAFPVLNEVTSLSISTVETGLRKTRFKYLVSQKTPIQEGCIRNLLSKTRT